MGTFGPDLISSAEIANPGIIRENSSQNRLNINQRNEHPCIVESLKYESDQKITGSEIEIQLFPLPDTILIETISTEEY
jgi:hypothetical protein